MRLLCLSNGHGEDIVAVRILEQLQRLPNADEISALPLVGEGYAYRQRDIPILGRVRKMPSGGFVYMDNRQLWRDIQGGLIQLTLAQYKVVKKWGQSGGMVLAVGDVFPLLLAWLSGANYAFVGTAKSEYYLRDEVGWLPQTSRFERWMGSVYLPWERWLMTRKRCKGVFPRDRLTTEVLQSYSVPAYNFGNPMVDDITPPSPKVISDADLDAEEVRPLIILLLPGSRPPEAYRNWEIVLEGGKSVISTFKRKRVVFLSAIAPSLDPSILTEILQKKGWTEQPSGQIIDNLVPDDHESLSFRQENATLILTQNSYQECLYSADVAIAMSGTATEQFVGLGKPVFTLPGTGPQFTPSFAEAQTRLLGVSVILTQPSEVGSQLQALLKNPDHLQLITQNGKLRLGQPGSALKITQFLLSHLQ